MGVAKRLLSSCQAHIRAQKWNEPWWSPNWYHEEAALVPGAYTPIRMARASWTNQRKWCILLWQVRSWQTFPISCLIQLSHTSMVCLYSPGRAVRSCGAWASSQILRFKLGGENWDILSVMLPISVYIYTYDSSVIPFYSILVGM